MASQKQPKAAPRPLAEFVRAKQRAACKVCSLPAEVLEQVRSASDKKIKRSDVLEWLTKDCGAAISDSDITTHVNGHHHS